MGLVPSFTFLGVSAAAIPSGYLVDTAGPRATLLFSMSLMTVAMAMTALTRGGFTLLLVSYLLIGLSYGMVTPSTNRAIMDAYYPHHAKLLGLKQIGVPISGFIGAIVFPPLALALGFRINYVVMASLCIATIVMLANSHAMGRKGRREPFRSLILSALRHRVLLMVSITAMFYAWVQQTLLAYYVIFLHGRGGLALELAELSLSVVLLGAIAGRSLWAVLSERLFRGGNRRLLLSAIGGLAGLVVLALPALPPVFPADVAYAFLAGATSVSWNGAYVTSISEVGPRNGVGVFSGLSLTIINLGAVFGPPMSGYIVDRFHSFVPMWLVLGGALEASVSLIFFLLFMRIGNTGKEPVPGS
ncbi:MFS transporter [Thermogymnomonas acidicola]|uniref:MFS transporter n=1 Tax=Thermogymnomonas acidicola TaxID=399579 RepID=UPI00094642C1|nr:MFS transporter [Thermogymnomonas acidicola]